MRSEGARLDGHVRIEEENGMMLRVHYSNASGFTDVARTFINADFELTGDLKDLRLYNPVPKGRSSSERFV